MSNIPKHLFTLQVPDLEIAAEAACEGGKILAKYWKCPPSNFLFKDGSHYDLVSEVDVNSDHAVQSVLKTRCESDKILSEELAPDTTACDPKKGRVWIIDPLDGTSAFLFRTDESAPSVMIALLVDGVTEVAVVYQPLIGQWTYAARGKGAFINGEPVVICERNSTITNAWVDMNHYGDSLYESDIFKQIDAIVRGNGGARLVSRSSPYSAIAIRILRQKETQGLRGLTACVHDHNPGKPKQLPWDIVPIQLIVEEAGGVYVDSARGMEDRLDGFDLKGPILVGNKSVVSEILARLRQ